MSKAKQITEALNESFTQFTGDGNTVFKPVGDITLNKSLPPGVYNIKETMSGVVFEKTVITSDSILRLNSSKYNYLLEEINKFWTLKEKFDAMGFTHKRGFILHGVPGTGKSMLIKMVAEDMEKRGDVTFIASSAGALAEALKQYREVEPERKVLVIIEELDEVAQYGQRALSELFDGQNAVGNVFYLATTNYLERISEKMLRPSRFDRVVEVEAPSEEDRLQYIKHKVGTNESEDQIKKLVERSKGMTFAQLKELMVSVFCLGVDVEEAVKRLHSVTPAKMKYANYGEVAYCEKFNESYKAKSSVPMNEGIDPIKYLMNMLNAIWGEGTYKIAVKTVDPAAVHETEMNEGYDFSAELDKISGNAEISKMVASMQSEIDDTRDAGGDENDVLVDWTDKIVAKAQKLFPAMFRDNEKYKAQDMTDALSDFVSAAVMESNESYTVGKVYAIKMKGGEQAMAQYNGKNTDAEGLNQMTLQHDTADYKAGAKLLVKDDEIIKTGHESSNEARTLAPESAKSEYKSLKKKISDLETKKKGLLDRLSKEADDTARGNVQKDLHSTRDEIEKLHTHVMDLHKKYRGLRSKSEAMFSSGEKMALQIIKKSLDKSGGFAVYRQGIGTEYFDSEDKAKARVKEIEDKVGKSPAPMILTKESPIFKGLEEAKDPSKKIATIVSGYLDNHSPETKFKDRRELGNSLWNMARNGAWGDKFGELLADGDSESQKILDKAGDQIWSKLKKKSESAARRILNFFNEEQEANPVFQQQGSIQPGMNPSTMKDTMQKRLQDFRIEGVTVESIEIGAGGTIIATMKDLNGDVMTVIFAYDKSEGSMAVIGDADGKEVIVVDLDPLAPPVVEQPGMFPYINMATLDWMNKSTMLTILNAGDIGVDAETKKPAKQTYDAYGNILGVAPESFELVVGRHHGILVEAKSVALNGRKIRLPIVRRKARESVNQYIKALFDSFKVSPVKRSFKLKHSVGQKV